MRWYRRIAILTPVEREVRDELARQTAKFGAEDHLDYDPHDLPSVLRAEYEFRAQRWREINDRRATTGCERADPTGPNMCVAWDGILLEEAYEALAENDSDRRRVELVQVAAVAQRWATTRGRRR